MPILADPARHPFAVNQRQELRVVLHLLAPEYDAVGSLPDPFDPGADLELPEYLRADIAF